MINALQVIAERKIAEAIQNGTLNTEEWKNKPLPLEDDRLIPEDLRMAYKILKNAGFLPPEIEAKKEIQKLEDLIAKTEDEHTRIKQLKKLEFLLIKLSTMRQRPINLEAHENYHRKITERVTISSKK